MTQNRTRTTRGCRAAPVPAASTAATARLFLSSARHCCRGGCYNCSDFRRGVPSLSECHGETLRARATHSATIVFSTLAFYYHFYRSHARAPRPRRRSRYIYVAPHQRLSLSLFLVCTQSALSFFPLAPPVRRGFVLFFISRARVTKKEGGVCARWTTVLKKKRERQTHLGEELADSWIIHNAFAIYMCVCNVIARYSKSVLRAAAWRVSNNAWFVLFIIFRSYRRGLFSCRYDAKFCLISYCLSIIQTNVIRVYKMKQLYNDTFVQSQRFRRRKKTFTCDLRHSYREISHP